MSLHPPPRHCKALGANVKNKALRTEFNPNDELYHQETQFLVRAKVRAYKKTTSKPNMGHYNLTLSPVVFQYTRTVTDYSLFISKRRLSSLKNQILGQLYFRALRFSDKQLNFPLL